MCGRKKIILFEHMRPLLPGGSVLFVVKFRLRELRWFSSVWDIIVVQAAKAVGHRLFGEFVAVRSIFSLPRLKSMTEKRRSTQKISCCPEKV